MKIVISKTNTDGIGNVLKGFISALSVCPETTIECNPNYIFGDYNTILDKKHIFNGESEYERFYTCRLRVLLTENQENIPNEFNYYDHLGNSFIDKLFSKHIFIDWNYDVTKINDSVRNRILDTIDKIEFHADIISEYNRLKHEINTNNSLGISVRTWKCIHESNINRPYSSSVYKEKIKEVLKSKPIQNILLSADNPSVINEYVEYCKEIQPDINIFIIDNYLNMSKLQNSILKVLLLSQCPDFICNRISTFSELVFWFGKCKQNIYPLF